MDIVSILRIGETVKYGWYPPVVYATGQRRQRILWGVRKRAAGTASQNSGSDGLTD